MRRLPMIAIILAMAFTASFAPADIVTIDGYDAEWWTGGLEHRTDGDEGGIPDQFDILRNWHHWGTDVAGADKFFFMQEHIATRLNPVENNFVQLLINTLTGGGDPTYLGADRIVQWDLDGVTTNDRFSVGGRVELDWYWWAGGLWLPGGGPSWGSAGVWAAWEDNPNRTNPDADEHWSVEWEWDPYFIYGGGEYADFGWAAITDNGYHPPDDRCPGFDWERFIIPEPGTLAMFGLGLIGIVAMRRRKREE